MTNIERLNTLSEQDRAECIKNYSKGVHPLFDYIDWKKYWNSEDGNEMHFVNSFREFSDENGYTYLVLHHFIRDGIEFLLTFCINDESFFQFPASEEENIAVDSIEFAPLNAERGM